MLSLTILPGIWGEYRYIYS